MDHFWTANTGIDNVKIDDVNIDSIRIDKVRPADASTEAHCGSNTLAKT